MVADYRVTFRGKGRAMSLRFGVRGLLLAGTALHPVGCGVECPEGRIRVGNACPFPMEAGVVSDAEVESGVDAGMDSDVPHDGCQSCLGSELCFENACYPFDECSRTFGVPCEVFGPTYLKASNVDSEDFFGGAVAWSGDRERLAVFAPGEDSGSLTDQSDDSVSNAGAVYVFRRAGAAWTQEAYLKPSVPRSNFLFSPGGTVVMDQNGDTLATVFNEVGVTVFGRNGSTWSETAMLEYPGEDSTLNGFPASPALSADGTVLAVGASTEDSGGSLGAGAVYVYRRVGTQWSQPPTRIEPDAPQAGARFGDVVTLNGDGSILAAAATNEDVFREFNQQNAGAVYVFTRSGDEWTQEDRLVSFDIDRSDSFGSVMSLSRFGSHLAVGVPLQGAPLSGPAFIPGVAYVFERVGGAWSQTARLTASNAGDGDRFGFSVSIDGAGDTLAIGAPQEDTRAQGLQTGAGDDRSENSGAVYMFELSSGSWSEVAYIKGPNSDDEDGFGSAVSLAPGGDWLAVSAFFEDSDGDGADRSPDDDTATDSGAAYVYRVSP